MGPTSDGLRRDRVQLLGCRLGNALRGNVDVDTNSITLYRNGLVADEEIRPSDITPGDSTLHFGGWNMGDRLLSGGRDDIAIWQRALTPKEITALTVQTPTRLKTD